jgi:hypothetical protein
MTAQGVFTVVTEVQPDHVDALSSLLEELDNALSGDSPRAPVIDFRMVGTVHFARFVILPPDAGGRRHLVFSSAYDGPLRLHLSELLKNLREGLCTVYEHCAGFPATARTAPATLLAYLETNSVRHSALHIGYVGRTMTEIAREDALRGFIEDKLDAFRAVGGATETGASVRRRIIQWVEESEHRWALEPREGEIAPLSVEGALRSAVFPALLASALVGSGVLAFAVGGVAGAVLHLAGVAAVAGGIYYTLRHHEEEEPAKSDTNVARGLEHAADEDFTIRNQLTHLVEVKPGLFRRSLLASVLAAVEFRARFEFYKGDLGGIETIHCAYWVVLQGTPPRLLFFSNYDGSWERYLDDFIEEAGGGMTSVWSNTRDFPRTKDLLFEGAQNERVFKAWTREHQVRTAVWYATRPDVSIRNVNDNSRLRDGLCGSMTEDQAEEWLRLI